MANNSTKTVRFAAIDKQIKENIISPVEKQESGKKWVSWGTGNKYPQYLEKLKSECPTLASIIRGNIDFIVGDAVTSSVLPEKMNKAGDTLTDVVRAAADAMETYGGRAYQIIRGADGRIAEVYAVSPSKLRVNEGGDVYFFHEDWNKGYIKDADVEVLPAFNPSLNWAALSPEQRIAAASSILYITDNTNGVYPVPIYAAAVKACEMERKVDDFHLNALDNGFAGSYVLNLNNGIPDDEQKDLIERSFNEKFAGTGNAGRVAIAFNADMTHRATFDKIDVTDFGAKYESLAKHSRQQIFTAFRAIPALFGLMNETTGFNSQEFNQSFKLYNRTQIRPIQRKICDDFDYIFGGKGIVQIVPFTLDGNGETTIS